MFNSISTASECGVDVKKKVGSTKSCNFDSWLIDYIVWSMVL